MCGSCKGKSCGRRLLNEKCLHQKVACKETQKLLDQLNTLIVALTDDQNTNTNVSFHVATLAQIFYNSYNSSVFYDLLEIPNDPQCDKYIFKFYLCACLNVPIFVSKIYGYWPEYEGPTYLHLTNITQAGTQYIPEAPATNITYLQALCKLRDFIEKGKAFLETLEC